MSLLIKKEIRLLLPAWIAAMALALVSLPVTHWSGWVAASADIGIWSAFTLAFLLLGIASFGQELASGSFAVLLAQPMERKRLWQVKTGTLASAFILVLFVWAAPREFFFVVRLYENKPPYFPFNFEERLVLLALTIFSGSLWTTLLLRQIVAAFWLTLLAPLAITYCVGMLSDHFHWPNETGPLVLVVYSIAGFFWARRLFLRAQDTLWTGGEISFPWRPKTTGSVCLPVSFQRRHWLSALVSKEIRLHQSSLLIAVIFLFLNLSSAIVLKIHPQFENPDIQFIFESVWLFWLLMPLFIGAAAIAEERKLGVMESQSCLPMSRRAELFVKFTIALGLSLFLGGALPLLTEGNNVSGEGLFFAASIIFFISFYASSTAYSTLQGIGLAIVCASTIWLFAIGAVPDLLWHGAMENSRIGLEVLRLYLGIPLLVLFLSGLTFWNFKWLHERRKLWSRNTVVVLSAFVSILFLTHAIYFRFWEFVMPHGPGGPARLTNSSHIRISGKQHVFYTTLPNGRLWAVTLILHPFSIYGWHSDVVSLDQKHAKFLGDSNWIEVTADDFQAVAVQANGTLWCIQTKWDTEPGQSRFKIAPIGFGTNWAQAAGGSTGFFLLKKDGSLWTWGTHGYNWRDQNSIPQKLKLDLATPPVRIGDGNDWQKLVPSGVGALAQKSDGSRWCWRSGVGEDERFVLVQETNLGSQWSNFAFLGNGLSFTGVKTNGQLWLYSEVWPSKLTSPVTYNKIRLGQGSQWKIAVVSLDHVRAIRDDGTLWEWHLNGGQLDSGTAPVQLGRDSEWITLTHGYFWDLAMAADGSLWNWDFQPSRHVWLGPPRPPHWEGNVLNGTIQGVAQ